jgi:hypothetical protein
MQCYAMQLRHTFHLAVICIYCVRNQKALLVQTYLDKVLRNLRSIAACTCNYFQQSLDTPGNSVAAILSVTTECCGDYPKSMQTCIAYTLSNSPDLFDIVTKGSAVDTIQGMLSSCRENDRQLLEIWNVI